MNIVIVIFGLAIAIVIFGWGYVIGTLFTTIKWEKISLSEQKISEGIHRECMSEMQKIIEDQNKRLITAQNNSSKV